MCVEDQFVNALTADGIHYDALKNDVNLSAVGPHYVGVNLTDIDVRIVCTR